MKETLLAYLVCPRCQGAFEINIHEKADDGEILEAELSCSECRTSFPVHLGIPRILEKSPYALYEQTRKSFAFSWKKFSDIYKDPRDFLDWIYPKKQDFFEGKLVLDAGCGTGKHAVFASKFGARDVIAFDLSNSVEVAFTHALSRPNVHVVQANIYHLPFRNDFDFIYSIGVLQHLPQPERGFEHLSWLLRNDGWMSIWVYGYEGTGFVRKVVDPVRRNFTSRMPLFLVFLLSFFPTAAFYLLAKGIFGPLLRFKPTAKFFRVFPLAPYFSYMAQFEFFYMYNSIFDQLIAPITNYFRREELESWFAKAGLKNVLVTGRNDMSWRATGQRKNSGTCS